MRCCSNTKACSCARPASSPPVNGDRCIGSGIGGHWPRLSSGKPGGGGSALTVRILSVWSGCSVFSTCLRNCEKVSGSSASSMGSWPSVNMPRVSNCWNVTSGNRVLRACHYPARASQCQAVFSAIRHAVATIEFTTDGLIVDVNDLFLDVVGYHRDEVVGKHHSLFCDREVANSAEYRKFWDTLRAGQAQTDTFPRRR